MKKKVFLAAVLLCISICFTGCGLGNGEKTGVLDEPMKVDNVLSLTIYDDDMNGCYQEFYPYNAVDEYSGYDLAEDGEVLLCLYGVIENLSPKKFDISDIVEVTILIDNKYEYEGILWLENEDETELMEKNILQPKAEEYCVLISSIGEDVAEDTSDVKLTFDIQKDVDGAKGSQRFVMELEITN